MQASDIVQELVYRKTLRDQFFPDAVFDAVHIRELFCKTGELTNDELAAITAENADLCIERLKKANARFNYQIIHSRDLDPTLQPITPGAIASISDETKTINVFPRDVEALRVDPPKVSLQIAGTGVSKFNEFIRTGRSQDLGPDEILGFSSEFDFMLPKSQHLNLGLSIKPSSAMNSQRLLLRVTFGNGDNFVRYDCIEFEKTRQGTDEAELASIGRLPFRIRLVINLADIQRGGISIEHTFIHADVREVKKLMNAVETLRATSRIEFYDLRAGKILLEAEGEDMDWIWDESLKNLVDTAVRISDHYGVDLKLPSRLTEGDRESLGQLASMISTLLLPVNEVTVTLKKVLKTSAEIEASLRADEHSFKWSVPELHPRPVLFGVEVPTGSVFYFVEKARVKDKDKFLERLKAAQIGESVPLTLTPLAPVQISALGKKSVFICSAAS